MRSGHIVYKVNNLQLAVEEWESKGFEVEYILVRELTLSYYKIREYQK